MLKPVLSCRVFVPERTWKIRVEISDCMTKNETGEVAFELAECVEAFGIAAKLLPKLNKLEKWTMMQNATTKENSTTDKRLTLEWSIGEIQFNVFYYIDIEIKSNSTIKLEVFLDGKQLK